MNNAALFLVGLAGGIGAMALVLTIRGVRQSSPPPTITTSALRCSTCGVDWPPHARDYARCPACLKPTDLVGGNGVRPLDLTEARSIRLHHEFERFYTAWNGEDAA